MWLFFHPPYHQRAEKEKFRAENVFLQIVDNSTAYNYLFDNSFFEIYIYGCCCDLLIEKGLYQVLSVNSF